MYQWKVQARRLLVVVVVVAEVEEEEVAVVPQQVLVLGQAVVVVEGVVEELLVVVSPLEVFRHRSKQQSLQASQSVGQGWACYCLVLTEQLTDQDRQNTSNLQPLLQTYTDNRTSIGVIDQFYTKIIHS